MGQNVLLAAELAALKRQTRLGSTVRKLTQDQAEINTQIPSLMQSIERVASSLTDAVNLLSARVAVVEAKLQETGHSVATMGLKIQQVDRKLDAQVADVYERLRSFRVTE